MKRALKASSSPAQQPDRHLHVSDEPVYLLTIEAARLLCFDRKGDGTLRTPDEAMRLFREWAQRQRVPSLHRGRTLVYERRVLVAFLEQREWTKKHAPTVTARLAVVKPTRCEPTRSER